MTMSKTGIKSNNTNVSWRSYGDLALFTYRSGGLYETGTITDQIAVELKGDVYEIVITGAYAIRRTLPNHMQVNIYLTMYQEEIGLVPVNFDPVLRALKPRVKI